MAVTVRIHITGAAGSGTSTLGRALAARLAIEHVETDDYLWEPTDPPYLQMRAREERLRLLQNGLLQCSNWVLSGSLTGWGDPVTGLFDVVLFLRAPTPVRLRRLKNRELTRFGAEALAPGGRMHAHHVEFLEWAAQCEDGDESVRSLHMHRRWLATLAAPVLELEADRALHQMLHETLAFLETARGVETWPGVADGRQLDDTKPLTLREAATEHEPRMFRLHELVFRKHVERLWGWSHSAQVTQFDEERCDGTWSVILCGERLIGYLQTQDEDESIRLCNIAVHPDYQRLGLGSRLLRDLQCCAHARGVGLALKVFVTNPDAQRLYVSLGFMETGRDDEFVSMLWVPTKEFGLRVLACHGESRKINTDS